MSHSHGTLQEDGASWLMQASFIMPGINVHIICKYASIVNVSLATRKAVQSRKTNGFKVELLLGNQDQ